MSDEHQATTEPEAADSSVEDSAPETVASPTPDPDGTPAREPEAAVERASSADQTEPEPDQDLQTGTADAGARAGRKPSVAGVLIGVLLALLGFTLVVQLKSNAGDAAYASLREADLVQIMSDLDAAERRLRQDIAALEQTKRELQSGAAGRDAALEDARERADALGILAGTLKARGPGLRLSFFDQTGKIRAETLLNAVQELRGAGAEALQIDGSGGSVRIIASTSFVDSNGGILVDGRLLRGPYTIRAIGDPTTMLPAMLMWGGVQADVAEDGGTVNVDEVKAVEINEVRAAADLEYARPVR